MRNPTFSAANVGLRDEAANPTYGTATFRLTLLVSTYIQHLLLSNYDIIQNMKAKHAKTLRSVFTKPTLVNISFSDLESLVIALGGEVREGDDSRVVFEINGKRLYPHRPHPGKEAKRYQVEEFRALPESEGIKP